MKKRAQTHKRGENVASFRTAFLSKFELK